MSDKDKNAPDKQTGVNALNQDFSRYDQVKKSQSYRLSETDGREDFDDEFEIKICDMRLFFDGGDEEKMQFANELGSAMEDIGFAILTGHGVDTTLYDSMPQSIIDFFASLDDATREKYLAKRQGSVNQGYFPVEETTIIHPDRVEGWVFCRRAFDLDGDPSFDASAFWPDVAYEKIYRCIVLEHERLILPVMQSILSYLGCDPHAYDKKLTGTNFGFRLNYYPPMDEEADSTGGRMLGHEDVDLFTFLPAPEVEGLQVLNRRNMKWIQLVAPPGSIILNTGDYIQRITNDRLPSTTHRVSRPRSPELRSRPRVSFPMAIYVWEEEILEVLPGLGEPHYEPVSAIEFHTHTTAKYYGDDYAVKTTT